MLGVDEPYCSRAQALPYHDLRAWQQLLTDTDTQLTEAAYLNSSYALAALLRATGEIRSTVRRGGAYDENELAALAASATADGETLRGVCADLAFWHATKRRWPGIKMADVSGAQEAHDFLDLLGTGEAVLGIPENIEAGKVTVAVQTAQTMGPPSLLTATCARYFGRRGNSGLDGRGNNRG